MNLWVKVKKIASPATNQLWCWNESSFADSGTQSAAAKVGDHCVKALLCWECAWNPLPCDFAEAVGWWSWCNVKGFSTVKI